MSVKVREISRARANILLSSVRRPEAGFMAQELAWFETEDSRVIAVLVTDADGELSSIILARDGRERFRAVAVTDPAETMSTAAGILQLKLEELMPHIDALRIQGDEVGKPVDFFRPGVRKEKLHANYRRLATGDDFAAARSVINELMRWYEDVDGNFIEQFQTTGFDARVWELYLFAALAEDRLQVTRPVPGPDMLAGGLFGAFALEATTIQPSKSTGGQTVRPPVPHMREDLEAYVRQYLPIRYAGPLSAKLRRRYWDFPSVIGKPLVLAIQDFHAPLSMVYSYPALPIYLYGFVQVPQRDSDGRLTVKAVRMLEHRWGTKVVPSGFFFLPGAEYISAVIFNDSGTINKFNRIGVGAGFGSGRVTLVQSGMVWDPDPHASEPLNRPGMSGDSTSWEGWSHVREYVEALPAGAAGAGGADGRRDQRSARFGVGSDL